MNMQAGLAIVTDGNVADRAQNLALLADLDLLVGLPRDVKLADGRVAERADRGQGRGRNAIHAREGLEAREGFVAVVQNDDPDVGRGL